MTGPAPARVGPGAPLDGPTAVAAALRAPLFAASAVGVSALGHVAAGGAAPGGTVLAMLLVLVGAGFCAVVRCELSIPVLVLALGAVEAFLHVALSLAETGPGQHHAGSWQSMLVAHLLADVACVVWLRAGEAVAGRLARWLLPRVERTRRAVPLLRPRLVPPAACRTTRALRLVVLVVDPLRGPPAIA